MASLMNSLLVYQFLKRLASPFTSWDAYTTGVIDKDGNIIIPAKQRTAKQNDSFQKFDLMLLKIKKLIGLLPLGKSHLANYVAALWFLKEWDETESDDCLFESIDVYFNMILEDDGGVPINNVGAGHIAGANQDPPGPSKLNKKLKKFSDIITRVPQL